MGDLSEHEKLIEQYMSEDNTEAAVQLLSELIVKSRKQLNGSFCVVLTHILLYQFLMFR